MKKKEQVLVTSGIKGSHVYLTIDCPDSFKASLYVALLEDWLLNLAKTYPTRTQIIEE